MITILDNHCWWLQKNGSHIKEISNILALPKQLLVVRQDVLKTISEYFILIINHEVLKGLMRSQVIVN